MLLLAAGFFASIYELALTRLMMNTVGDHPGATQYFALQSVIVSLLAGLSPIMWGWMLDNLDNVQLMFGGLKLDSYAIFFGLQWLLLGAVFVALMWVREGDAAATKTLLYRALVLAPGRRFANITHRPRT